MSESYEEILEGESLLRSAPGPRHERLVGRLHELVRAQLLPVLRLLEPRSVVSLSAGTILRPDLALVTAANGRIWLAMEVINADDHRVDTVVKKMAYENANVPRLWMVDPRYNNVEVYHASPYGLALKQILAGRDELTETLLPGFQLTMTDLFGD